MIDIVVFLLVVLFGAWCIFSIDDPVREVKNNEPLLFEPKKIKQLPYLSNRQKKSIKLAKRGNLYPYFTQTFKSGHLNRKTTLIYEKK